MSILGGIVLAAVSAVAGMFLSSVLGANHEECPYMDRCKRYDDYRCSFIKKSHKEEK